MERVSSSSHLIQLQGTLGWSSDFFSLPLFAVGLVSLWNAAVSVLSGALVEKSASNLVVGGVVTLCFILVPLALLSFALFTSGQNLSIDLVAGTATHKRRSLFGTRKGFPDQNP